MLLFIIGIIFSLKIFEIKRDINNIKFKYIAIIIDLDFSAVYCLKKIAIDNENNVVTIMRYITFKSIIIII